MAVYQRIKRTLEAALATPATAACLDALLQLELSRELERLQERVRKETPGNPAGYGFKTFSQADEDGILEFIFNRLEVDHGSFVEIGCGNGVENNTHYLLLKGWKGVWMDADEANISKIRRALPESRRLHVIEAKVNRDNVPSLLEQGSDRALSNLDLLSVDIDGNDLEVALACSKAWRPRVIVVEYNAKFAARTSVQMTYDPGHRWTLDDYHGASLRALTDAFHEEYRLVSCNLAGTNAFFVRQPESGIFGQHETAQLYQPARFYLTALRSGHAPTLSFLRKSLAHSQ